MSQEPETTPAVAAGESRFHQLAVFGLMLVAVTGLLLMVGALIQGDFEFLIFALVFTAIASLLAFLTWWLGGWWRVLAVIGGALAILFNGPATIEGLSHFDSFFDFAPNLFGLVGAIIAILAGLAALILERPGAQRPAFGPMATPAFAIAGVLVVVSVISLIVTLAGIDSVSDEERENADAIIEMKDFEFDPENVQLSAGETVSIVVENKDIVFHTFTIDELDVDEDFGPSDDKVVEFTVPESGDVRYHCDVEGHEDMEGVIEISE